MHYQPITQLLCNMFMCNSCAHLFPPPSTESVQSSSSGGTPTIEWVLKDVIGSQGLGTPERLKRLKEMRQRKTEHGETIVTSSTPSTLLPDSTPHSHLEERFWQLLAKIFPPNHTVPILSFKSFSGCQAWIWEAQVGIRKALSEIVPLKHHK